MSNTEQVATVGPQMVAGIRFRNEVAAALDSPTRQRYVAFHFAPDLFLIIFSHSSVTRVSGVLVQIIKRLLQQSILTLRLVSY